MPQLQGVNSSAGGRLDGSLQKYTVVLGDFALGAGWGASSLAVTAGSTDQRGQIVITCATGGGLAQATATIVFTFKDGAYASAPFALIKTSNDNALDSGHVTWSSTTTALTMTYSVLPVNTKIYTIDYVLIA